ncbi:MAG: hypothetical protein JXL81_14550 [Deltaproteobacteria bacterium]|nr:hypothetical protein [Deltaproteobacteria bacterium]
MKKLILLSLLLIFSITLYADEFPRVKGWTANGDVITYKPSNLWEYIDGAANLYLAYDFKMLKLQEFQNGDTVVTVEIYDMGSPINAFGIYSSERPDDTGLLQIGTEAAVAPPYHALMLKDRFYVKVVIQQGELDTEKGEGILRDVDIFLPGKKELPSELKILPETGIIHGTVKYITEGYMGLSEINNIVYADYKEAGGNVYRSFVMVLPDKLKTEEVWKKLAEKWEVETVKDLTVLHREVPYEGIIGVVKAGGMITGVSGVEDKSELIRILLKN